MTVKRFTINDCRVLSNEQVLKILNQLTEENEQLKQELDLFRKWETYVGKAYADKEEIFDLLNQLNDENEQLKTFLEALREELSLADRDNTTLEKENEQLKQDKDLFAQCICDLSNLLYDNKIEHKLPKDIKDFITVWGVRVE